MNEDILLVDLITEITDAMRVPDPNNVGQFLTLNYEPGRDSQIIKSLIELDESMTLRANKYPLIALMFPIRQKKGGGYTSIFVKRLLIATITIGTDGVKKRYQEGGTFKGILYPCYYEFMRKLAFNRNTVIQDPHSVIHTLLENPGEQPIAQGLNDFVDTLEINDLEIKINKLKNCKK